MIHLRRTPLRALIAAAALMLGCSEEPASERPAASAASEAQGESAEGGAAQAPSGQVARAEAKGDSRSQAELIAAGRSVYNANCIACHSVDPTKDGALGPAVAGSSYALIEARVLRGGYPEGYKPKRDTRVMVALPHLEPKLDELAAYLGSF